MARNWYDSVVPEDAAPAPCEIDVSVAHPARVYDYWLGGQDNFAADRAAAKRVLKAKPGIRDNVRANRRFLTRAVRFLAAEAGVQQFLDIGTGIPAANNTHEVTQAVRPGRPVAHRRLVHGRGPVRQATWCCPTRPATWRPTGPPRRPAATTST